MIPTQPVVALAEVAPIAIPLVVGVLGILLEAFLPRRLLRGTQITLAFLALAGAAVALAYLWGPVTQTGGRITFAGAVIVDGPTLVAQAIILLVSFLALLVIIDRTATGEDHFTPMVAAEPGTVYESLARRKGYVQTELYPLYLFAVGGLMWFPAVGDLLALFVALEVFSLPLYLMIGMARRARLLSQEASLKYFVLGAFASAFMLFGVALLYGYAGSVRYQSITDAIATGHASTVLLIAGVALVLVGLLFKVGAVPFHTWTPDVYQGAPTPMTGFMASAVKVGAFAALLRFVYVLYQSVAWDLNYVLWGIAVLTMLLGTVLAIVQTDVKRMLAYSSVAHAGFVLVGVFALNTAGLSGSLFYLLAYGAATVGAFGVVSLVRRSAATDDAASGEALIGEANHLSAWAGLGRRNPWVATSFAIFLLSFAGIPLTAGFTGKFVVFAAAVNAGLWWLVLIGVLASAAAAFFYVRLIVLMFFTEPNEASSNTVVVRTQGFTGVAIGLCMLFTIGLGVFPQPFLDVIASVAQFLR